MANGVTVTTGNNTSPPNSTKFQAKDGGSVGFVPGVLLGYSDGSDAFVTSDVDGLLVQGTTTISDLTVTGINTPVHVGDAVSSTLLIATNSSRKGWTIQNNSTANLMVKLGSAASSSSFTRLLRQYETMGQKIMDGDLYTGDIYGIWASDAGGFADGGDW